VHARYAGKTVVPADQRERRRQRPQCGPGVAQEQIRLARGKASATAFDPALGSRSDALDADTERLERLQHAFGVVRNQEVLDSGRPLAQSGEQQGAVGDALRPRQAHRAGGAVQGSEIEMVGRVHGVFRNHASRAARADSNIRCNACPSPACNCAVTSASDFRNASMSATSASALAIQMSRHISAELPAMRVKSRKPLAANENSSSASVREAIISTSVNASTCGKWLTAENTASWRSAVIRVTCAPHERHIDSTISTAAARLSGSGVSTTRRPSNKAALAASTPVSSAPAIGCPGTTPEAPAPSISRAAATKSCLVLPASVTTTPRCTASRN